MTALQEIAAWAVGDGIEWLPGEGVQLVKRAFVDTLGVTLLGARLEGPRIVAEIECSAGGRPEASIVAMRRKTEVRSAALINGTSAHADLFDDNSAPMIAHPSAPLVSALLPLAQVRGATGRAVLQAQVEIATVDGEKHVERCEIPPGGSSRPMSDTQVAAKFRTCAAVALEPAAAERVLSMIDELETLATVADLCELLEGGGAHAIAGEPSRS